mmetsp:Transcript_102885/g.296241  ORF Transcript_102885/g.296241 Transcript_102885/m.296241 type:complete len:310 (+) Transcript_102885:667-1596(+)
MLWRRLHPCIQRRLRLQQLMQSLDPALQILPLILAHLVPLQRGLVHELVPPPAHDAAPHRPGTIQRRPSRPGAREAWPLPLEGLHVGVGLLGEAPRCEARPLWERLRRRRLEPLGAGAAAGLQLPQLRHGALSASACGSPRVPCDLGHALAGVFRGGHVAAEVDQREALESKHHRGTGPLVASKVRSFGQREHRPFGQPRAVERCLQRRLKGIRAPTSHAGQDRGLPIGDGKLHPGDLQEGTTVARGGERGEPVELEARSAEQHAALGEVRRLGVAFEVPPKCLQGVADRPFEVGGIQDQEVGEVVLRR